MLFSTVLLPKHPYIYIERDLTAQTIEILATQDHHDTATEKLITDACIHAGLLCFIGK
jgi:hypothetical protein